MSASAILTHGLGSFGSVNHVLTQGLGFGVVGTTTQFVTLLGQTQQGVSVIGMTQNNVSLLGQTQQSTSMIGPN